MNRFLQSLASFTLLFLMASDATAQVTVQTDPQVLVPSCRAQNGFTYNGVHIDVRAAGVVGPLPANSQYAGRMACVYYGIGTAPGSSAAACDNAGAQYEAVSLGGIRYCAWPHDGQVAVTPIHASADPMPPAEAEFPMPLYWEVNPPASPNACVDDANFVQIVGDWRDRTVCEVNLPAISAAECPMATPPQHGRPLVFPADFSNPRSADLDGTQFCVYPPTGAHYGAPDRLWYISGWRAVRIIAEEPEFEVTKTLDECESFGPNAYRCVYNIRIENHGGPYAGELQIEDVTNQRVNRLFLFDANQTPINCQVFTQPQPQQLSFSAGTLSSRRFDICTLPNVSIDAATPLELTALVQIGGAVPSPSEPPLNCAVVVMWDDRPDGIPTEDFPSSCVDALTAVSPGITDPRIVSARDTEFPASNWAVDHCPDVDVGRGRSTYTAGQTATDGNPAPAYAISHQYNLRIALCHLYQAGVIGLDDFELSGIEFAFDAQGTHNGRMAIAALIIQDGTAYWGRPWANVGGSHMAYSRVLKATDFTPVFSNPQSAQHPDFGCGAAPLTIGFVTANQTGPGSTPANSMHQRSAVMDNWSFEATLGAECPQ